MKPKNPAAKMNPLSYKGAHCKISIYFCIVQFVDYRALLIFAILCAILNIQKLGVGIMPQHPLENKKWNVICIEYQFEVT